MRKSLQSILRAGILLGITVFFLAMVFRRIDVERLWETFRALRPAPLLPALLVYLAGFWIRALKWRQLLRPIVNFSTGSLFRWTLIGCLGNAVLPARLGEILRARVVSANGPISTATAFSSILVERTLEVASLLLVFVASAMYLGMSDFLSLGLSGLLVGSVTVTILRVIARRAPRPALPPAREASRPQSLRVRAVDMFKDLLSGMRCLDSPSQIVRVILLGTVVYGLEALAYYGLALSLGLAVTPWQMGFLVAFVFFGMMIPASVGNIGPLQYFTVLGLSYIGVDAEAGLIFSILLNALMYVPAVAGLPWIGNAGLSVAAMRRLRREGAGSLDAPTAAPLNDPKEHAA